MVDAQRTKRCGFLEDPIYRKFQRDGTDVPAAGDGRWNWLMLDPTNRPVHPSPAHAKSRESAGSMLAANTLVSP
jgi:hypothetical protein